MLSEEDKYQELYSGSCGCSWGIPEIPIQGECVCTGRWWSNLQHNTNWALSGRKKHGKRVVSENWIVTPCPSLQINFKTRHSQHLEEGWSFCKLECVKWRLLNAFKEVFAVLDYSIRWRDWVCLLVLHALYLQRVFWTLLRWCWKCARPFSLCLQYSVLQVQCESSLLSVITTRNVCKGSVRTNYQKKK